jgi:hypothetical protein
MVNKLKVYVASIVDQHECDNAFTQMCIERAPLKMVNHQLYGKIEKAVDDFLEDNELDEEWLEDNVGDIEDIFNSLFDE